MRSIKSIIFFILFSFLSASVYLSSQEVKTNYTAKYRNTFAVGVDYQNLFALADLSDPHLIFDLGATIQFPLPLFPYLSPQVRFGMTRFDNRGLTEPR